jgi:hypothetical protein
MIKEIRMMKNAIFLLFLMLSTTVLADQVGGAAPSTKGALENGVCQDEAVLNDLLSSHPLICTNGKWRKVVFKDEGNGSTSPLFYEGRCSIRFTGSDDTKGKITLKEGEIADICLPVGWKSHLGATKNSIDWDYMYPQSMPNVVLVKAAKSGAVTTLWIYPVTNEGKVPQKFEIELHSTK